MCRKYMGIDVLAGLLDEKLIKIISLFMKYPDKQFSLSEVSQKSGVTTATTFRILNKLVKQNLIGATIIGKSRIYRLSRGERASLLAKFLKKDDTNVLDIFVKN